MAKSIIGYYSEPLTQVERDEILDIISPLIARENTVAVNNLLLNLVNDVIRNNEFVSLSHTEAANVMTKRLQDKIRECVKPVGILKQEHLSSITIDIDSATGDTFLSMSDEMGEFYKLEKLILPTIEELNITPYTIHLCNDWLHNNPNHRIFEKTQLALQVDSVNRGILKKLVSHGYQSETGATIHDFSKEILSFFNEVQKG